jgi:hypothetical protein
MQKSRESIPGYKNKIYIPLPGYNPLMKVMRCTGLSLCALILILILSVCMGCTSGPAGQNQSVPTTTLVTELKIVPFSSDNSSPETYTLEDAVTAITTDYQNRAGAGRSGAGEFTFSARHSRQADGRSMEAGEGLP